MSLHTAEPPVRADVDDADSPAQQIRSSESRNLFALAMHHVALRIAWIFKTESVIMPAFVDHLVGGNAGWIRGCLPTLNRIGQSVPPLYLAESLRRAPRKKPALVWTTFGMALPFLGLALLLQVVPASWAPAMPYVFLAFYAFFFVMTGLNHLAFGTTQGKLIRITRRGRLLALSGVVGSVVSIGCAWYLMRDWLRQPDGGFMLIFAFAGAGFVVSSAVALLIHEPSVPGATSTVRRRDRRVFALLSADRNLRRLCGAGMLFVCAQLLFPHYQALGRLRAGAHETDLMVWVIAQNAGAGLFSLVAGVIADRLGNRLTIRVLILGAAATPLVALWLAGEQFAPFYWVTFIVLGTVPTTFKALTNYCLELTDESLHPQYISTMKVCLAVPFVLSPLVGLCVDRFGFTVVFRMIAVATACGGVMTFLMAEPRHALRSPSAGDADAS